MAAFIPALGLYCAFCPSIIALDWMMIHHCNKLQAVNGQLGSLGEGHHNQAPALRDIEPVNNAHVIEATVMETVPTAVHERVVATAVGGPSKQADPQLTLTDRLRELHMARDQGLLSDQEFEAAKAEVLSKHIA